MATQAEAQKIIDGAKKSAAIILKRAEAMRKIDHLPKAYQELIPHTDDDQEIAHAQIDAMKQYTKDMSVHGPAYVNQMQKIGQPVPGLESQQGDVTQPEHPTARAVTEQEARMMGLDPKNLPADGKLPAMDTSKLSPTQKVLLGLKSSKPARGWASNGVPGGARRG